MAFFEGTFLWEVSVHSNSGQGAHPTTPPPKKNGRVHRSLETTFQGVSRADNFRAKDSK